MTDFEADAAAGAQRLREIRACSADASEDGEQHDLGRELEIVEGRTSAFVEAKPTWLGRRKSGSQARCGAAYLEIDVDRQCGQVMSSSSSRFRRCYPARALSSDMNRAYLLARRDGYFEYGRRAGHLNREQTNNYIGENIVYPFVPMVAWIQRFAALVNDARSRQTSSLNYSLVLNIPRLEGAVLGSLGDRWREPFDGWHVSRPPTAIERSVQLQLELGDEPDPKSIGRWFAERIDNVFGVNEVCPRCYNHPKSDGRLGPPGDLPGNGIDYMYG